MNTSFPQVAQTLAGLEPVLANELRDLGATEIVNASRAVTYNGTLKTLYQANLCCRTAIRVLVPIHTFPAPDEKIFYEEIKKMKWEEIFTTEDTFSIEAITANSVMTHSKYIGLKAKDAIADRFREISGNRPSVNIRVPDVLIHIRLSKDVCTVSLDSTGTPLYKRGYRTESTEAPINEVLAAGLILLSGWDKTSPFMDPMCGSATFSVEAALIAKNMPPGFLRKEYVFMKWKKKFPFDHHLWNAARDEAFAKRSHRLNADIYASDILPEAVKIARETISKANLSHEIKPKLMPFDQTIPPRGNGVVMLNPPYGERLTPDDLNGLYQHIGDHLKKKYTGYTCWILTSNEEAAKHIGLHASKKIKVFNGQLECSFMKFDLYEGTKKRKTHDVEVVD